MGIGATAPIWSSIAHRYVAGHFEVPQGGRQVALLGDAELDEGAIWETLLDPLVQRLGEVLWVVDLNRQSLDRIVPDIAAGRMAAMFEAAGWHTATVKYGRWLRELFDATMGRSACAAHRRDAERGVSAVAARSGATELRERLPGHGSGRAGLAKLISELDDEQLLHAIRDLGGYFDRMTMPIGMALLFLMAVAPVLPWRKASGELLRTRLQWPAWAGAGALVVALALGARGLAPLLAFALGGFAAGAALRQVILAAAARRNGDSAWRGVAGRANGGMVVHLGVVVVAVAFAASSSYTTGDELRLDEGETASVAGHTITYLGHEVETTPQKRITRARGAGRRRRARAGDQPVPQRHPDHRLALGALGLGRGRLPHPRVAPEAAGDPAVIGVLVEPLASWLWIGGGIMALGTVLAIWPGPRRRRPTEAVSAGAAAERPEARAPLPEPVG